MAKEHRDPDSRQDEENWLRTVFLAGASAMREECESEPRHDLWEHTSGARMELRFKEWLRGVVGEW
jgi:hypothetical protein